MYLKESDRRLSERSGHIQNFGNNDESSQLPLPVQGAESHLFKSGSPSQPQDVLHGANVGRDPTPQRHVITTGHRDSRPKLGLPTPAVDSSRDSRFSEQSSFISNDLSLEIEDLNIPWSDLVLKERIGAGMPISLPSLLLKG